MKSHRDLNVWQNSIQLVTEIYTLTKDFPKDELFGLTNQLRSALVSIPSNIAEGAARNHEKEFIQFLYISLGSCAEIETQMIISKNLEFIDSQTLEVFLGKVANIRNMLIGLIKAVKSSNK
ncbi:MAG: four helix bundle protein [Ignavibacteriales bacterium CG_4_9_14_3_um_filter_34_10]|nr:MAG: four helix bundle protein [Ignavibacteriales bacterium CG_4_9_14_3_um_filter_34_10]